MAKLPSDLSIREWHYSLGEQVLVISGLFSDTEKLFEVRLFDLTRMHVLSAQSCDSGEELFRRQAEIDAELQSAGWSGQNYTERAVSLAETRHEAIASLVKQWQAPWAAAGDG